MFRKKIANCFEVQDEFRTIFINFINKEINMSAKKKYKKQLLKSLKNLAFSEHHLLETMTNLMLLKEMKKNNITFHEGDTFSFEDRIFDYSTDKNIRKIAALRKKMLKTMNKLVQKNSFKDKELEFLA
ncbi:MAG: hypothetical protein BGO40_11875 [Chryseobacterium sp. 39-10]|nr:MAG: hypothetical protein BGO40_11875 [Chryseobacterium sp. 39-10]